MKRTVQNVTTEAILATTAIGAALTILGAYWYQRRKKFAVPSEWEPIGNVKSLFIYPLKGGYRKELTTAICSEFGLQTLQTENTLQLSDRNLIIYKEETYKDDADPKTLLIETAALDENHFTLDAPGMSTLKVEIPNHADKKNTNEVNFWTTEKIFTIDCGDEAARWVSKYILGKEAGLRLGFNDGLHRRNITQAYKKYLPFYPNLQNSATGLYSNLSSYLLINQSSINDLRSKTPETSVTANNFRPNILVENAPPYAEDDWKWIKIGEVILYLVKPCTRCVSVNMNPETALKNENNEPLRTLRKYRLLRDLKKIELDGYRTVMGNNMGLHKGGQISIGDVVYVGKS